MKRIYIVLVDGVKARERLTLSFALKDVEELKAKGCHNVSVAEKLVTKEGGI